MSLQKLMCNVMTETQYLPEADVSVAVTPLTVKEHNEVIAFLAERPVHNVVMAGFIRDNGLVSPLNRGTFYGCRNSEGRLEGVALIGHVTLVDARTRRATEDFALTAQTHSRLNVIMGELDKVEEFWNFYADEGQEMRLACRELLFELRRPPEVRDEVEGLRRATAEDLDLVAPVQAALAEAEGGVNPLDRDPVGFLARCARRIQQGRTWVLVEDGRLLFKAEVQADTPDVIYLEGIYTSPSERGTGVGRKCLTQLSRLLLQTRTRVICLLANEENEGAHAFYRMCGYKLRGVYDTIYLKRE